MTVRKRIALIHAVTVAMQPIDDAFAAHWPDAERVNLLDDALSVDRAKQPELTEAVAKRIGDIADYAVSTGADAILYTCSAFGPAIEAVAARMPVPVLKPNEAMFDDALAHGCKIGMVATFAPAVATMEQEFSEATTSMPGVTLRTLCVPDAMAALRRGDAAAHNRLVADAASSLQDCDVIMLAHFSTARALAAVRATTDRPVLTSPDAAVLRLKRALALA